VTINAKWFALIGIFVIAVAPSVVAAQIICNDTNCVPEFLSEPTVSIGYLSPKTATTFSLSNSASNQFKIISLKQTLDVQGVWMEFTLPIKSSGPLGLVIDFGYLFPVNSQSDETYNISNGPASRTWNTSSQLSNLSVAVTYHIYPHVTAIAGFRYDSFMTNYAEYENPVPNRLYFNPEALGGTDFSFSGYIPFFGAVADASLGYATRLKAGLIGFPALPGSFEYREVVTYSGLRHDTVDKDYNIPAANWNGMKTSNEFSSGYFLEAFGQVSTPINWWAQAGAFLKYSGVYGKATADVNTTIAVPGKIHPPDDVTTFLSVPQSSHDNANAIFQRSSWILGGMMSTRF
jgi:hypothetical protein